jgi:DNA-directed RNA polymerase specialized sigma24 family protein
VKGSPTSTSPPPAAVRRHDEAFAALYEERRAPSVRLAVLLVDRLDVAEELVQEAFAALYRSWDRVDEPAAFLRTAVVNRCRDVQRHRVVLARHPEPAPEPVATNGPRQPTATVLVPGATVPSQRSHTEGTGAPIPVSVPARPGG